MSMKKRLTLILAVLSAAAFTAAAGDVDSLWTRAVEDYTDGRYEAALEEFTSIEEQGFVSADLFYNIGNCYYRLDHYLGKAILYYERALKYDPSYEDAAVNLGIARQYTLDRIDSVPEFILLTWIKALRDAVPSDGWAWTAAALLLLTAVMVLLFRFGRSVALRKTAFALAVVSVVMVVIAVIFSLSLRSAAEAGDEVVVTVPVCNVKGSPGSSDQSLFILHEGTKAALVDQLGDWYRIELSDGRQGWLDSKTVEII